MGDIAQRGNRLTTTSFPRIHVRKKLTQDQHGGRIKRKPRHPADLRPEQEIRRSPRTQAKRAPTHPDDLRPKQEPRLRRFGGGRTNLLEELGRVEGEHSNRNRRDEIARVHSELNKGYKDGGRIGLKEGTPKLGGAAKKRKIEQTKAVKRLTTSDDAYSPEKRIIHASKPYYNGSTLTGSVNTRRNVTDWHNIKKEKEKLKGRFGPGTRVNVYTEKTDPRRQFRRRNEKRAAKGVDNRQELLKLHKERYAKKAERRAEGGRIGFKKGNDKNWIQKATASIKKRGTKGKCTPITKKGCTGRAKALAKTFKKMAAKRKA